jgi:hypothetical protein
MVFAALGIPTGPLIHPPRDTDRGGDKTAMMPKRRRTREQNRAAAITAERRANRQHREHRTDPTPRSIPDEYFEYDDTTATDSDPPPF